MHLLAWAPWVVQPSSPCQSLSGTLSLVKRAVMITKGQKVMPKRTMESGYKFLFPTIESACKEFSHLMYTNTDPASN